MKLKPAHEKALRATLRVTLFAALGACGGGTPAHSTAPPSNKGTANAPARPTTDAECRAALTEAFPNGDPKWYQGDHGTARVATGTSDADLVACCDSLSKTASTEDYRQLGCCSTKFDGPHCTPWGPPMPPAMRAQA